MDICYPFYAIYKIYLYALSYISFIISSFFSESPRKIRLDESKNTTHITYSKDEYDRTMIKRDSFSVLPFNQI